jgi:hypothetical protein
MSVRYLAETATREIESLIKTNIATVLAALRTERGDAKVSTEPPQSYFIYEEAKGYRTPAVFIIARNIDFQKEEYRANHITAKIDIGVSVLVEDKDKDKLAIKAWRYQAALHEILDQAIIEVTGDKAKLFLIVKSADFSPVFTLESTKGSHGVFRKEVALSVDVQQRESF